MNKRKKPLPLTKSKQSSMVILQPAAILSLNEHGSIDEDKIPVNPWTPLSKTYTASPKIVSTEL